VRSRRSCLSQVKCIRLPEEEKGGKRDKKGRRCRSSNHRGSRMVKKEKKSGVMAVRASRFEHLHQRGQKEGRGKEGNALDVLFVPTLPKWGTRTSDCQLGREAALPQKEEKGGGKGAKEGMAPLPNTKGRRKTVRSKSFTFRKDWARESKRGKKLFLVRQKAKEKGKK